MHKAKAEYEKALKNLEKIGKFCELYLEVLRDLIKLCRQLGNTEANLKWKEYVYALESAGIKRLYRLLEDTPVQDRLQTKKKFTIFSCQMRIDTLAKSPDPKLQVEALEIAEALKNLCLSSLRNYKFNLDFKDFSDFCRMRPMDWKRIDIAEGCPKYKDMQELLDPQTAGIYWHISPAALTTFILHHNKPPQVWTLQPNSHTSSQPFFRVKTKLKSPKQTIIQQLNELEKLIEKWKRSYGDYRNSKTKLTSKNSSKTDNLKQAKSSKKITVSYPWQQQIPNFLENLAEALDIKRIVNSLDKSINKLILFPHCDLHLLPLEALFPENLTILRLPSAQIGLDLQKSKVKIANKPSLLSIEYPETSQPLLFAEIESAILANLYRSSNLRRITGINATKETILQVMGVGNDIFHFTGHAEHNIDLPPNSALVLAGGARLSMRELLNLPNKLNYYLVCLSACETGISNKSNIIDEFVGLVTAFLAKGSNYVISTLWTVDEISSALIMIEFYRYLQTDVTPPEALKKAKNWLRTVTYNELVNWYRQRATEVEDYDLGCCENLESAASNIEKQIKQSQNSTSIKQSQNSTPKNLSPTLSLSFLLQHLFSPKSSLPNTIVNTDNIAFNNNAVETEQFYKQTNETHINCPYSHPYYWAGFTVTGKVPNTQ